MAHYYPAQSERLLEVLRSSTTITFLTGAGVSTQSGIPDFATLDEEWPFDRSRAEMTSLAFFKQDPRTFWAAYRYIFNLKTQAEPNPFHRAVAGLESRGKYVVVCTQNVDGLHQKAGSSVVNEMHGNATWARCSRSSCGERALIATLQDQETPRCARCNKFLRPDTVLFGERPRGLGAAEYSCVDADVLVVAGTRLEVGPVNTLPLIRAHDRPGSATAWLNRETPPSGYTFSHVMFGDLSLASQVLNDV